MCIRDRPNADLHAAPHLNRDFDADTAAQRHDLAHTDHALAGTDGSRR